MVKLQLLTLNGVSNISNLFVNIEISPQMCYNTLKKGNNFHSKLGKVEVSNLTNFDSLIFTLSVGGEGGNVNDTIFTLFAAYLF